MTTKTRLAALALAMALLGAACSDDDTTSTDAAGATSSTAAEAMADDTMADDMAEDEMADDMDEEMADDAMGGALRVVDTEYGEALATADGMVLYAFQSDVEGTGTCVDDCAVKWPPVEAGDQVTYDGAEVGSIERTDGTRQLTIAGKPVYTFSGDLPGEASCQGGDGVWWILQPDGAYNTTPPVTG